MMGAALIPRAGSSLALALLGGAAAAQEEALQPEISRIEVLTDQVGAEEWVRFRLVLPRLDPERSDALRYEDVEPLFQPFCEQTVLPYLQTHGLEPDQIVISLSDRFVEFGTSDPEATQYFEQFRPERGDCIWEEF